MSAAAAESGVALLGLTRGASWAQLAALLRSLLAEGDVGDAEPETLGGMPSGDLFTLANAIAALLDAPITIEDRSSRVLAFSGRQDEADPSRVETILGRQVPERYSRLLSDRGVFRDLYRSNQPLWVEPPAGRTGSPCRGCRRRARRRRDSGLDLGRRARTAQRGAHQRAARRERSWSPCTCCGSEPAPTSSGGCAPTCSPPRWKVAPAPAKRWTASVWPTSGS